MRRNNKKARNGIQTDVKKRSWTPEENMEKSLHLREFMNRQLSLILNSS
jgi:hypothetical protein